ncbi:MAG: cytochrome d ubiquinol oxidase subunit II [Gammaproteobacteria bacterium]|nr:cytochrome d ubiquinol oxidase subunit II [Gammaproteobacteria bacterium]
MNALLDYDSLRIIWWVLICVLLIGLVITDGFDLGVGALITLLGKNDKERRVMINTIGPHWDGNQVWLITAGGAIFAAWPIVYATAFSGFYLALFAVLTALWMRPLGFDYRSKLPDEKWRTRWDWAIFASGVVPSLIFGVAIGNLLLGVPFEFDETAKATYTGSFFGLLRPFALLSGVVSLTMLLNHGCNWLQLKTDGLLRERARQWGIRFSLASVGAFVLAGICVIFLDGYVVKSAVVTTAPSNPLAKEVIRESGAWLNNYYHMPILLVFPVLGIAGGLLSALASSKNRGGWAFVSSSVSMIGIIMTAAVSMFPFLMPSNTMLNASLTMWDATSSHMTLKIMFFVACFFVPIILGYTSWGYWVMRGRIKNEDLDKPHTIY